MVDWFDRNIYFALVGGALVLDEQLWPHFKRVSGLKIRLNGYKPPLGINKKQAKNREKDILGINAVFTSPSPSE